MTSVPHATPYLSPRGSDKRSDATLTHTPFLSIQPSSAASAPATCAWSSLYTIRPDPVAQRAATVAAALEDDPDSPDARPPGVITVRTAVKPSAGCELEGSPDPPSPAAAAAMARPPASLKSSLTPLPPMGPASSVDTPADGKTAGGAAPARQQMAPPGPPGPIAFNRLILHNNFTEKIAVVTAGVEFTRPGYYPGVPAQGYADRWAVLGWFWVQPGEKTIVFNTRANKVKRKERRGWEAGRGA